MLSLIAAVVLVGAVCAINLLLTLAVIRRLAEYGRRLAQAAPGPRPFPAAGTKLADFTAASVDGLTVSTEFFEGPTVVGVFSTNCSACHERLSEFTAFLNTAKPERALALVVGDRPEAEELSGRLPGSLPIVIEDRDGPMSRAFQIPAYPSFYLVDGEVIVAAAGSPDDLPAVVTA
jgi:hypothetical protein